MSLLSFCTQLCNGIPIGAPATIVGNTASTAKLLLSKANEAGEALARRPQGGWVAMIKEYDFETAALGPLSGNIANTGPNGAAQITGLSGTSPMVPNLWAAFGTGLPSNCYVQTVNSSSEVTLSAPGTITGAGTFNFGQADYVLPSDFERSIDNTFWDRSRFWSMRGPQSPQQWQLYKSSVIGRASIQRRYRFLRSGGITYLSIDPVPTDNGSALVFEYASNAWCESDTGTPQTSWQADTDIGILDEYLIMLGTKWRVLERLGMAYASALDEYEREADKATADDGGAAILDLTPPNRLTLIGPWNLPETNFGNVSGS